MNPPLPLPATNTTTATDWSLVDADLAELEQHAASEVSAETFYANVMIRLRAWNFTSCSLWAMGDPPNDPQALTPIDDDARIASHRSVLQQVSTQKESERTSQNFFPWRLDNKIAGGIFIENPDNDSPDWETRCHLLRSVAEICGLFNAHMERRAWQQRFSERDRWQNILQQINASVNLPHTAYLVANEGRRLIGCDRVCLAIREGTSYRLRAVSGAEHIHRRAESVRASERLASVAAVSNQTFWSSPSSENLAPQIQVALNHYLDESPVSDIGLLPCGEAHGTPQADRPLAILLVEQFNGQLTSEQRTSASKWAADVSPALQRNWQLQGIPGLSFWLMWQQATVRRWWLSRSILWLALIAAIVAALCLIPATIEVRATGELQPVNRIEVFAPRDGVVTDILVDHGSRVGADDRLLEIRSPDFDLEQQRVIGELKTTRSQLEAVMAERLQNRPGDAEARIKQRRLSAEEEQFQEQIRGLEARQELLRKQFEELTIRSPMPGEVITWNVKQRLSQRPLRRGDALLTVADVSGPWELELRVPARRSGRLLTATSESAVDLPVTYRVTSRPGTTWQGTLKEMSRRIELSETGEDYVLLKATLAPGDLPNVAPGTTVTAHIACGRGLLGVAWFHEVLDAVRWWLTW